MTCRTVRAACVAAGAVALAVACTAPPQAHADAAIRAELSSRNIVADSVTCPATVPVEVGQSVHCQFVVDGQPVDAIATITAVSGSIPTFAIVTEARPIARDLLARKVGRQMHDQAHWTVDTTTCTNDLAPRNGAEVTCTVVVAGKPRPVMVAVTGVTGGLITYDVEQDGR